MIKLNVVQVFFVVVAMFLLMQTFAVNDHFLLKCLFIFSERESKGQAHKV